MYRALLFAILLTVTHSVAKASDTDWSWNLSGGIFGTEAAAADGFDSLDQPLTNPKFVHSGVYYQRNVDGWNGDSGFYASDIRSPLPQILGQSKTWVLYLWQEPGYNPWPLQMRWDWNKVPSTTGRIEYELTYIRSAQGATGVDVPVGTYVILNDLPQGNWTFPSYQAADGRTGYMFTLTATVIPEPSSLLALLAGLGGLGAMLRKRRRG